jgi:hypothetical protein
MPPNEMVFLPAVTELVKMEVVAVTIVFPVVIGVLLLLIMGPDSGARKAG